MALLCSATALLLLLLLLQTAIPGVALHHGVIVDMVHACAHLNHSFKHQTRVELGPVCCELK